MTADLRGWLRFAGPEARRWIAVSLAVSLLLAAVEAGLAAALREVTLAVAGALRGTPGRPMAWLLLLAAIGLVRGGLVFLAAWASHQTGTSFSLRKQRELFELLLDPSDPSSSQKLSPAQTHAAFQQYLPAAGTYLASLAAGAAGLLQAAVLGAILFWLAPFLAAGALAGSAALGAMLRVLSLRSRDGFGAVFTRGAGLHRSLAGVLQNLTLMKLYRTERRELAEVDAHLQAVRAAARGGDRTLALASALPQTFGVLLLAGLAASLCADPSLLAGGGPLVFLYLLLRLASVLGALGTHVGGAAASSRGAGELRALLAPRPVPRGGAGPRRPARPFPSPPPLRAAGLSYSHPGGRPLLDSLDFVLPAGGLAWVRGRSGSGKSTLLSLLLGLIAPDEGELLWDGRPLDPEGLERLRASAGYVGPEPWLKDGTLRQNLAYGRSEVPSASELERALRRAGAGGLARARGLDSPLGLQGRELSTGEKQRLSLARALLREPTVLVLDEPTSHLDAATREEVLRTLFDLKGEMTVVLAAHDPACAPLADVVVDLDRVALRAG